MTSRLFAALGVAAIAWLGVGPAKAAMLSAGMGEVMVNRGDGYRFVTGSVELKPGDMIIVNGGVAQLFYNDSCSVPIQAGAVVTVETHSPCATQGSNGSATNTFGLTPGSLAVGAVVIGGGIGAAALLSGSSKDKPASP